MILPSVQFLIKRCHKQWRSSLFRTIIVVNRRQLTTGQQKSNSKSQDNHNLVESQANNQIEVATFKEKGRTISCEIFPIRSLTHSPTSCERYRLFSYCCCWSNSIR